MQYTVLDPQVDAVRLMVDDTAERIATLGGSAIEQTEELDPVTQDMLIEQAQQLEMFHWFVRAHLENPAGRLRTAGARTERSAARRGRR